jgi:hypothetical protein
MVQLGHRMSEELKWIPRKAASGVSITPHNTYLYPFGNGR